MKNYCFWFCTGSQDLYGDECLSHVAAHSKEMVEFMNASGILPYEVVWKPTLIDNALIRKTFNDANADENCAGVITWMHTFSPAKSWILGLQEYKKPLCHLHTQYLQEIPYDTIDMDYMNEHQSAHGDREYGHIVTRMGIERKVIMGYWKDEKVLGRIASWMRTAVGVMESSHIRIMRIADNMRNVAVTEGDKVEAQIKFGWEVDAYPVNEICKAVDAVTDAEVKALTDEYYDTYKLLTEGRDEAEFRRHVEAQAKIEIGFERFLKEKDYQAIVTHFGDLGSLQQLPGLAIQRLMQKGYGFGAEGDWKTAGMVRLMKIAVHGQPRGSGTSGVHLQDRPRHRLLADRSGPQIPPDHQRSGLQEEREAHAEASGRDRILDAAAQPADRRRELDHLRRRTPHRIHLRSDHRADGRLGRRDGYRSSRYRCGYHDPRPEERASLERCKL